MSKLIADNRVIVGLFCVLMVLNAFAIKGGYYA